MRQFESQEAKRDWIELILLELREGRGNLSEIKDLRELLMSDPEAQRIYLRSNQLDAILQTAAQGNAAKSRSLISFFHNHRSQFLSAAVGAAVAACVTLLAVIQPFQVRPQSTSAISTKQSAPAVASLESVYHADLGGDAAINSEKFGEGALSLKKGIAQLAFSNGAQIVLEGECGFEIRDEMTVILNHGKLWAYCPETAHGFKILTPGGKKIVDLGTEFGVAVTKAGVTDVHVFDGLVDVISDTEGSQLLEAGSALTWESPDATGALGDADPEKFTSANSLASKRLLAYEESMRGRNDLLLHYNFTNSNGRRCQNIVPGSPPQTHGRIEGTNMVNGRFRGSSALQFEYEDDRIELEFPPLKSLPGITKALWVKVDRFDSSIVTLLNGADWDRGVLHFQVDRRGYLLAGLRGGFFYRSVHPCVSIGQWHLLAVAWDFQSKEARLYCDGVPLRALQDSHSPRVANVIPRLDSCQVGAWIETVDHRTRGQLATPRISREFKGRIDEVLIFDHSLDESEMSKLYELGSP